MITALCLVQLQRAENFSVAVLLYKEASSSHRDLCFR